MQKILLHRKSGSWVITTIRSNNNNKLADLKIVQKFVQRLILIFRGNYSIKYVKSESEFVRSFYAYLFFDWNKTNLQKTSNNIFQKFYSSIACEHRILNFR